MWKSFFGVENIEPFKSPGHGAKKQPATVTVIPSIPKHCSIEDQIRLLLIDVILCCYIKGHGWKFNFIGSTIMNYNIKFDLIPNHNSWGALCYWQGKPGSVKDPIKSLLAPAGTGHCQWSLRVCSLTEWSGQACIPNFEHKCTRGPVFI